MDKLKDLLAGSKKAAVGCLLVAVATLGAVIYYIVYSLGPNAAPAAPETPSAVPAESLPAVSVTLEDARQTALDDAGLTASQVSFSVEALREEQGVWMYQLNFRSRNSQFEYLINGDTGAIYSKSKETRVLSTPEPTPEPTAPPTPSPTPEPTPPAETSSQPPQTAQPSESLPPPESQPPASDQPEPSPSPTTGVSSSVYIGMDRAKAIALEHAGLTASQVWFTRLHMARQDGRMVYQLKFRQDTDHYEYDIDASTGRILTHRHDAN